MQFIKQLHARLRPVAAPSALVLMYHRVADLPPDPYELTVSPAHFAQQLDYLQQHCHPLSLHEFVTGLKSGRLPPRAVVLTFDDGYANNFTAAYPLLAARQIPATIFMATGYLDGAQEFWWDQLERIILLAEQLPDYLQVRVQQQVYEWPTRTMEQRVDAYKAIHQLLRLRSAQAQEELLAALAAAAGLPMRKPSVREAYRVMTTAELLQIAQSPFIEIGAHTVTHPYLAYLSRAEQHRELVHSRGMLEEILEKPIRTVSYPFGNFTTDTVKIAKAAGFQAALATKSAPTRDLFRIPRYTVADWPAETLERHLERFFYGSC